MAPPKSQAEYLAVLPRRGSPESGPAGRSENRERGSRPLLARKVEWPLLPGQAKAIVTATVGHRGGRLLPLEQILIQVIWAPSLSGQQCQAVRSRGIMTTHESLCIDRSNAKLDMHQFDRVRQWPCFQRMHPSECNCWI
jgi:hypothetical protein